MRFSYSKLSTFLTCPQKYYLKYMQSVPEIPSQEMSLGKTLHDTIHKKLKNATVEPTVDDYVLHVADKAISELTKKYTIIGSEVYFEIPFYNHTFEGFIDIVAKDGDGRIYVLDFKLGSGDMLQTKIYARMLEISKNKLVDFVGILKINLNGEETVSESIKPFTDREVIDEFLKKSITQMLAQKYFDPKPSHECLRCAFVEFCPLKRYVLEKRLEDLPVEEKLNLIFYIDAFKDALQKQLKDILQTAERIETENTVAYFEETSYKRLAVKKLPDEVYTTLFDTYGFEAFEPRKELVEEHFPSLFKTVAQKRLKIVAKEG